MNSSTAATAVTGALLAYVLPAASPGTVAMIPDRLAGWLASVAGTLRLRLTAHAVAGLPHEGLAARVAEFRRRPWWR